MPCSCLDLVSNGTESIIHAIIWCCKYMNDVTFYFWFPLLVSLVNCSWNKYLGSVTRRRRRSLFSITSLYLSIPWLKIPFQCCSGKWLTTVIFSKAERGYRNALGRNVRHLLYFKYSGFSFRVAGLIIPSSGYQNCVLDLSIHRRKGCLKK